ncbi:hypothetical protein ACOME3_001079 [Neoechinorhynchus agilis]
MSNVAERIDELEMKYLTDDLSEMEQFELGVLCILTENSGNFAMLKKRIGDDVLNRLNEFGKKWALADFLGSLEIINSIQSSSTLLKDTYRERFLSRLKEDELSFSVNKISEYLGISVDDGQKFIKQLGWFEQDGEVKTEKVPKRDWHNDHKDEKTSLNEMRRLVRSLLDT